MTVTEAGTRSAEAAVRVAVTTLSNGACVAVSSAYNGEQSAEMASETVDKTVVRNETPVVRPIRGT